ncbi:hypothetical protein EJ06DRAFT_553139 [Trichodelitschia bisporula]|uniref:Uncharacterized protein n=1 Tax=Trichodelitschia bisporula TaxID=703511 RepID=A0A6G1I7H9_9PEZI|nr:hypothetical protein EJ06DRAFT_553139 [Trichodelitschia bisporula]
MGCPARNTDTDDQASPAVDWQLLPDYSFVISPKQTSPAPEAIKPAPEPTKPAGKPTKRSLTKECEAVARKPTKRSENKDAADVNHNACQQRVKKLEGFLNEANARIEELEKEAATADNRIRFTREMIAAKNCAQIAEKQQRLAVIRQAFATSITDSEDEVKPAKATTSEATGHQGAFSTII